MYKGQTSSLTSALLFIIQIYEKGFYMKKNLTIKETIFVASMLFGMFFGAGNLIFPVTMGQMAGSNMWQAAAGFLVTGVGLPLLGVAALGVSRQDGLLGVSSCVGRKYGVFFTCVLYLTIGPFFAIPRCATVAFSVGVEPMLSKGSHVGFLAVYSILFFAAVLFFSLRPGKILVWIGKILNPLFLCFLAILVVRALASPMGDIRMMAPEGAYQTGAFFTGMLEGYNTMDALAGLAFGIVVVNVIRELGITEPGATAKNTIKAGIFSSVLMAGIYVLITVTGAQSRSVFGISENGGVVLSQVAEYYFGKAGALILTATITLACLKTAVGLITSCGEMFETIVGGKINYRTWAIGFTVLSLLIANLGLNTIIAYSLPVLMFLYPLAVTLILLTLCGNWFGNSQIVYQCVTGFTAVAAVFDFFKALPENVQNLLHIRGLAETVQEVLPFSTLGFGWLCPALAGLVLGLVLKRLKEKKQ